MPQGLPELRVLEEALEVVEADEGLVGGEPRPTGQGDRERLRVGETTSAPYKVSGSARKRRMMRVFPWFTNDSGDGGDGVRRSCGARNGGSSVSAA